MAIAFDAVHNTFTLHTENTSYQLQIDRFGVPLHLYYGQRAAGCLDYLLTYADRGFSGNPYGAGTDKTYSYDALPQEFPVQGTGDYRAPLLEVRAADGSYGCALRYVSHEITPGKYALPGLPAVYAEEGDGAETLRLTLENARLGLRVRLLYGVLPKLDIITRAAVVENAGSAPFTVERLGTACLDLVYGEYDLLRFEGRHAMERQLVRAAVEHGVTAIGSRRGYSSHQYSPFMILAEHTATETAGRAFAMEYVYSGGFTAECERDQYGQTRLWMGLAGEKFAYELAPGESLCAPEVILSYSASGLQRLSHNLHRCLRSRVCRGFWRDTPRPLLLNSWEASYFDFTGESILALAREAKALGVELLVLDDGWFGARSDDLRALGDWTANEEKLGCSLGELSARIHALGLRFGLWFEPEMVNEDSALYRAHPDWAFALPGEKPQRSRYQLVLDLSRRDVCDWLYDTLCAVLDSAEIDYVKWDLNRSIAEAYSHVTAQGKVLYNYMLGLYGLLERLLARYPKLLIEGCSGGGGRFDAGMLHYCPQIWCSDNTDAIDRLRIQYGTSFGYPASSMGAHVSACPNHQTGRTTPFKTRAAVAMAGTFGYELDPKKLSEDERAAIREQAAAWKERAPLVLHGDYYRLSDPAREAVAAWSFVSPDGARAVVTAVQQEKHANMPALYVTPRGLTPGALYRDRASGRVYPADALMDAGFPLPIGLGQYESVEWELERVEENEK